MEESELESESDFGYYVPVEPCQLKKQPRHYDQRQEAPMQPAPPEIPAYQNTSDNYTLQQPDMGRQLPSADAEQDVERAQI